MRQLHKIKDISDENIAGILVNHENGQVLVFTKDILINQLQREVPEIIKSFDSVFENELRQLSENLSFVLPIIANGQIEAIKEKNELIQTCGLLLQNASNTIIASVESLRAGFRLQSGILIRSVIEMCAVVFHLLNKPEDLEKFNKNNFDSTKAISTAQKMLPLFGRIWGTLSNQFIHINTLHSEWHPLHKFEDSMDKPATTTIGILGISIYFLKISTELVYINYIDNPQHWTVLGEGAIQFIPPSKEELEWIGKALRD